jgi:hypothetical protein
MVFSFLKKKSEEIKHYVEKQRYPCHFYGFFGGMGVMIDQEGNQCALITDSYSPCIMQIDNQTPEWHKCSFNTEKSRENLVKALKNVKIFPNEFRPPEAKSWEGINFFPDWAKYITEKFVDKK